MKKKSILVLALIASTELTFAQLPSLGKAKSLLGSNKSNSTSSNNSTTATSSANNTPSSTTPASTAPSSAATPASTAKTADDAVAIIAFSNSSGQKSASYNDGDAIFARVDFTMAMKDIGAKKYNDVFIINLFDGTKFLNGKKLSFLKDADLSKSFLEFQMACSMDQAKSPFAETSTKTLAQQLGKGKHTIKVKLIRLDAMNNELQVAEGSFDLDLTNGKDKLRSQADSYDAKEIEGRRMPVAAMKNAAIEKDLMSIVKINYQEEITPLRATIDNTDWDIIRNDLGVITGRTIAGHVAFKVPRNGRCFYTKISIYQPYAGGGQYGKSKYYDTGVSSDQMEIKCENVMK